MTVPMKYVIMKEEPTMTTQMNAACTPVIDFLFTNRIIVTRNSKDILNVPIFAGLVILPFAHKWLFISVIAALLLGCRFSFIKQPRENREPVEAVAADAARKENETAPEL